MAFTSLASLEVKILAPRDLYNMWDASVNQFTNRADESRNTVVHCEFTDLSWHKLRGLNVERTALRSKAERWQNHLYSISSFKVRGKSSPKPYKSFFPI
jgi:hypothetical protein